MFYSTEEVVSITKCVIVDAWLGLFVVTGSEVGIVVFIERGYYLFNDKFIYSVQSRCI